MSRPLHNLKVSDLKRGDSVHPAHWQFNWTSKTDVVTDRLGGMLTFVGIHSDGRRGWFVPVGGIVGGPKSELLTLTTAQLRRSYRVSRAT